MLKVGRLADYGVLILHHLARVRPARVSVEALAEITHVPLPTVRKVLKFLADSGLVRAKRGPNGGYQIAREPGAISLAEAIAAVEGPLALTACCSTEGDCEIIDNCELKDRWPGVNAIIIRVLERTSLKDLDRFGRTTPHIPPPLRALGLR